MCSRVVRFNVNRHRSGQDRHSMASDQTATAPSHHPHILTRITDTVDLFALPTASTEFYEDWRSLDGEPIGAGWMQDRIAYATHTAADRTAQKLGIWPSLGACNLSDDRPSPGILSRLWSMEVRKLYSVAQLGLYRAWKIGSVQTRGLGVSYVIITIQVPFRWISS